MPNSPIKTNPIDFTTLLALTAGTSVKFNTQGFSAAFASGFSKAIGSYNAIVDSYNKLNHDANSGASAGQVHEDFSGLAMAADSYHTDAVSLANIASHDAGTSPSQGSLEVGVIGFELAKLNGNFIDNLSGIEEQSGPVNLGIFNRIKASLALPVTSDDDSVSFKPVSTGVVSIAAPGGGGDPPDYTSILQNSHTLDGSSSTGSEDDEDALPDGSQASQVNLNSGSGGNSPAGTASSAQSTQTGNALSSGTTSNSPRGATSFGPTNAGTGSASVAASSTSAGLSIADGDSTSPNVSSVTLTNLNAASTFAGSSSAYSDSFNDSNALATTDWNNYQSALDQASRDADTAPSNVAADLERVQGDLHLYRLDLGAMTYAAATDHLRSTGTAESEVHNIASRYADLNDATQDGLRGFQSSDSNYGQVQQIVSTAVEPLDVNEFNVTGVSTTAINISQGGMHSAVVGGYVVPDLGELDRANPAGLGDASVQPPLAPIPDSPIGNVTYTAAPSDATLYGPSGPSSGDVTQGMVGDCWLLAPLQAAANLNPQLIEHNIRPVSTATGTQYDVTFNADAINQSLQYGGRPPLPGNLSGQVTVRVDGQLPTGDHGQVAYAQNSPLWPAIFEKAAAKLFGGYGNLAGGWPGTGQAVVTGADTADATTIPTQASGSSITRLIQNSLNPPHSESTHAVFVGSRPNAGDVSDGGVVPSHCYTVVGVSTDPETGEPWIELEDPHNQAPVEIHADDFATAFGTLTRTYEA